MSDGLYMNGARVLRDPTGRLVMVQPDAADRLLQQGLDGRPFADADEQDLAKWRAEKPTTFSEDVAAAGAGAVSALGGALQFFAPPKPELYGGEEVWNPLKEKTGIDITDRGKGLPAQIYGAISAAGDADYERAKTEAEQQYLTAEREAAERSSGAYMAGGVAAQAAMFGLAAPGTAGIARAIAPRLGGVAGGIVRGGIQGAVESAVVGEMDTQTQARLAGQTEGATGEQLLTSVGLSTLLGGVIGGGAGGIGALIERRASTAAKAPIARRLERAADDAADTLGAKVDQSTPTVLNRIGSAIRDLQAVVTGAPRETIEAFGGATDDAARLRHMVLHADETRQTVTDAMRRDVTELEEGTRFAQQHMGNREWKAADFRPHVQDTPEARRAAVSFSQRLGDTIERDAAEIAARFSGEDAATQKIVAEQIGPMLLERRVMASRVARAAESGDVADIMAAVNSAKQGLGKLKMRLVSRTVDNPFAQDARTMAANALDRHYEAARIALEDPTVFGKAADFQRRINAPTHAMLQDEHIYQRTFVDLNPPDWNGFRAATVVPERVRGFVDSLGEFADDPRVAAITRRAENAQEMLRGYRELLGAGAPEAEMLDRAIDAAARIRQRVDGAMYTAQHVRRFERELMGPERAASSLVGPMTAPVLGAAGLGAGMLLGGSMLAPALGIAGLAAGMALRPATLPMLSVRVRELMQRAVSAPLLARTRAAVTGVRRGVAGAARATGRAAVATGRSVRRPATYAGITSFVGKHPTIESAADHRRQQLREIERDPEILVNAVQARVGDMPRYAPGVAAAMLATTTRAVQHLRDTMPIGYSTANLFQRGKKLVGRGELIKWAKIWATVNNPEQAIDDLEHDRLIPEQVRALKAVHPETLQQIRLAAVEEISKASAQGTPIPVARQAQLSILLDLGGGANRAMDPELIVQINQWRAKGAQQAPAPTSRSTTNLAKASALPQQRWPSQRV